MIPKQNRTLLFILPLIVLLCLGIWFVKTDDTAKTMAVSSAPEWDLRDVDMQKHFVRLSGGDSEYIPGAFLTPEEFDARGDIQIGRPKTVAEYYTARIRLLVPDGQIYAITFESVDYADRIFINGNLMQTVGVPGDSMKTAVPQTASVYYTVQPQDGVIEVVHQASNFVHKEGGNPAGLCIGSVDSVSRYFARQTQATAIIMGGCAFLFLVHLVLYLLFRGYRANLYFALFCLVWFFRTGVTGSKVITALFPGISWYFTFRVEYMAIPLACVLLALALGAMFEGLLQRWARIAIIALDGAAVLLFAFAPTVFMSRALPFVYAIVLLAAAYVLARFFLSLRKDRGAEKRIMLCAVALFIYTAIREMLYHNNILIFPAVHSGMLDFAALVFVLFQMTASFLGTMREVAAARESEQKLALEIAVKERTNRLKTDVMNTVSHELRTPLAVMMGYAQIVAKEMRLAGATEQSTRDLDAIVSEAQRMTRIVEEMQSVAIGRAFGGREETVSVAAVAEQIARLYAPILERKGTRLILDIPDSLPPVSGSADELTQVLFNLFSNAGKHTQNGEVTLRAERTSGEILLLVSDTGAGIPQELLPRVFERGVSGEENGTGLGLSICKEIIEAHGGHIHIQSQEGQGATVTFVLPIKEGGGSDE
jgi:signal transduction histidine kinase